MKIAYANKFKTSISIEPFLDFDPNPLVEILRPFVSESIWIGRMNYIDRKNLSGEELIHYIRIRKNYAMKNVLSIYDYFKDDPIIRWKDSIKKMLAKSLATKPF